MRQIVSTSILSVGALAGLMGALLVSAAPAEAKKMTCLQKYHACDRRCAGSYGPSGWVACHHRTCGPQYDRCAGSASLVANTKQNAASTKGPQSQRATGPFIPKKPNPTGGIVPKDRNPTGGIVPNDRNPTGGIVPSARTQRIGKR